MEVPIKVWHFILWVNLFLISFLVCCALWIYSKKNYNPLAKDA